MQNDPHDDPVHLGFALTLPAKDLFRLRPQYMPLGKVGGKPSWLNPKSLPSSEVLTCKVCDKPLCFLLQVYASGPSDPDHSFHRALFLFVCRNPRCSKPNATSNLVVFRCSLPRANDFYSFDGPMDPDLDGDVMDPRFPPDATKLCSVCGCMATKKCAKCQTTWYCSRDHQVIDWATHKAACSATEALSAIEPTNPANSFLFKEFGIELDQEYVPENLFEELADECEENDEDGQDTDDETEEDREKRMKEFQKFVESDSNKKSNDKFVREELEDATEGQKDDSDFAKFNLLVNLNPEQIIRYKRFGNPLRATSQSALPDPDSVPSCELCGSPRRFEMQLMPHLLSLIEVDEIGESIDWASVYVYTCSQSCAVSDQGYAKEFLAKQDFS